MFKYIYILKNIRKYEKDKKKWGFKKLYIKINAKNWCQKYNF